MVSRHQKDQTFSILLLLLSAVTNVYLIINAGLQLAIGMS